MIIRYPAHFWCKCGRKVKLICSVPMKQNVNTDVSKYRSIRTLSPKYTHLKLVIVYGLNSKMIAHQVNVMSVANPECFQGSD